MIKDEFIQRFITAASKEPSVLTLAGTGLNGAAQVSILSKLGLKLLCELNQVNVVSGSSFSYFIIQAYYTGGLRADQFAHFDTLNRSLHRGGITKTLARLAPVILHQGAFFNNDLLGETGKHLFTDDFCARTLNTFPANLRIWSYCQRTNRIVEISTRTGFGDMTVPDLIRATASANFLHGQFDFAGYHFLDPNFSPKSAALIRKFFTIQGNHLLVNFKRSSIRGSTFLLKQDDSRLPSISILRDFLLFILGIPNPYINSTHANALAKLKG